MLKERRFKQQKLKVLLKITTYGIQGFQTYSEVPVLEDPKARKNPNKTGTSNPTQFFVAKVCTRLSNRTTRVLYAIVQYRNPYIQVVVRNCVAQQPTYTTKFFQKIKNNKGL